MKIDAHSYKAFRESIRGDSLIKLINLMLRSAKCGIKALSIVPNDFDALSSLGMAFYRCGKLKESQIAYQQALEHLLYDFSKLITCKSFF